jgi:hypothetical protein
VTDLYWPSPLVPSSAMFGVDDFTASDESAVTGSIQTSTLYGTRRVRARLDFSLLTRNSGTLQIYQSLVASLQGKKNRIWLWDHSYIRRGSFATPELLANNTFASGTTSWVATGTPPVLTAQDQVLRVLRAGTTANQAAGQTGISTVVGFPYALRGIFSPASDQSTVYQSLLANAGATITTNSVTNGLSYSWTGATVAATSDGKFQTTQTGTTGAYFELEWTSLARCALVNGASQTGASINIDGLPVSTNGLLMQGDQVQIGNSLRTLVANLNSSASGAGYLQLSEPPTTTPADNSPVIIQQPLGRFVLALAQMGVELSPGVFGRSSLEFVEAP